MVEHGVFYVPTLTVHTFLKALGQETVGMNDAAWNWILRVCDDRWDTLERGQESGSQDRDGTDAGFFVAHGANAAELEDLVRGGFSPLQAIEAATRLAAECMDLERSVGTVEAGKYADLVTGRRRPAGRYLNLAQGRTDCSSIQRRASGQVMGAMLVYRSTVTTENR